MFPERRQAWMLLLVVGVIVALQRSVAIHNHGAGLILLAPVDHAAAPVGVTWAVAGFMLLGLVAAIVSKPMLGQAVLGAGLLVLAARGGPIDQWLSDIDSPRMYFVMAAEQLIWCVPLVGMALLMRYAMVPMQKMVPAVLKSPHYEEGPEQEHSESEVVKYAGMATLPIIISVGLVFMLQPAYVMDYFGSLVLALACMAVLWGVCLAGSRMVDRMEGQEKTMRTAIGPAFLAGVVTVAVGALGVQLLVRTSQTEQVTGGLIFSFAIASMTGHQMFATRGRLTMLLAPVAVGIGAFVWTGWHVGDARTLLEMFYHGQQRGLLPSATVLPVFYASAGVLGAVMGISWSQSLHVARDEMVLVA